MTEKRKRQLPTGAEKAVADRSDRRGELITQIADVVLEEGLGDLGLRGLARKLGTSDRMLIYYFETKNRLIIEVLGEISARLATILETMSTGPRVSAGQFLERVLVLSGNPTVTPFMRLWTEVVVRSARKEPPYDQVGREMVRSWMIWIEDQLLPATDPDEEGRSATLLSIIDGVSLLELAAPGSTKNVRPYLARVLEAGVAAVSAPPRATKSKRA